MTTMTMPERVPTTTLLTDLAHRLQLRHRLVAIDLEATGVDTQTDRIVQIAGYVVNPVAQEDGDYEVWAIGPHLVNPERPIPAEAIEACLGRPLAQGGSAEKPSAPGQLASHYAPAARVRLDAATPAPGEVWLSFGAGNEGLPLSPTGDLIEAAANLFHLLREADRRAGPQGAIAVAPIPDHGLGRAINDRLRRAAAPRP